MEQNPEQPQNVKHLENSPVVQTASNTLLVIGLVIGIFSFLAIVSYFFYAKTYSSKLKERESNALLYDGANEKNILGAAQITDLPELEIGGNKALNKQQPLTQQQAMQQQMMQQQMMQQQQSGRRAPQQQQPENKPPTPTQTPVPDNMHVDEEMGFKVNNQKWSKQSEKTENDIKVTTYKKDDSSLILYVTTTTKKYDTVDAYLETNPRNRKPPSSAEFSIGGKAGKKTEPFNVDSNGATYRSIGAYVLPKDGDGVIGIELDSTSLDVNNTSLTDMFKTITESFQFIDKKPTPSS